MIDPDIMPYTFFCSLDIRCLPCKWCNTNSLCLIS